MIKRRDLLLCGLASFGSAVVGRGFAQSPQSDIRNRTTEEWLDLFPYGLVKVPGQETAAKLIELSNVGTGIPVVVGKADDVVTLSDTIPFDLSRGDLNKAINDIVLKSGSINYPGDLRTIRSEDHSAGCRILGEMKRSGKIEVPDVRILDPVGGGRDLSKEESLDFFLQGCDEPYGAPVGDWPILAPASPGLTVIEDSQTGDLVNDVHIAIIPTDDPVQVPAYLFYGGWNANPHSEYHVAAMRSWHARYGAEIVGAHYNTLNIKVASRPQTGDEALELAREQYDYCADIVD